MGFQTEYTMAPDISRLGLVDGVGPTEKVTGYGDTVIPFGRVVVYGGAKDKVRLPASATDIADTNSESRPVVGVVLAQQDMENQPENTLGVSGANVPAYPATRPFSVMRKGRVTVWCEQAVTPLDQVFVRFTANGGNVQGNVRKDADGTTATAALLKGVRFADPITGPGLVILEINLPA